MSVTPSVVSINLGLPRNVEWRGRIVTTGIFKRPAVGRIKVQTLGLEGDRQADLTVHGGPEKAVYVYPSEHYAYWQNEFERKFPWGMFGENLTTQGLLEDSVYIGDRFRVGSAEFIVTQPRFPCYKLGIKFGQMEMVKRFLMSGKSGFYFGVLKEGEIEIGDSVHLIGSNSKNPSVAEVFRSNS